MAHVGVHCLLELYGCPLELLDDRDHILRSLREAAEGAGATWLDGTSHKFEPQGVTALGLLSESHISIHTWPELGYAAVDCFTCGDGAMPEDACKSMIGALRASRSHLMRMPRAMQLAPDELAGIDPKKAHMVTTEMAPPQVAPAPAN